MNTSRLAVASLLATVCVLPTAVLAVEEGPENALPLNISLTSDYRYRGISQSELKPAFQGGADWSHSSGIYLGTWASTIKWIKDAGQIAVPPVDTGNANVEWDFYGGWKKEFAKDATLDLGGLYYFYPNNHLSNVPGSANANTFELYAALSYGPLTAKYSNSMTNLFGYANSKNSGYLDISATFDLGDGWSVLPHVGRQNVKNNGNATYSDFSIIVGKDLGKGFNVSLGGYMTNANTTVYVSPDGQFLGKSGLVGMVKFNF